MVKVLVKKLDPKVKLPIYKTKGSSGMDLMAFTDKPIKVGPKTAALIPTGLTVAIPEDVEIQIRPRSGLALNSGISVLNTPGTVDSDYRGEIKVILFNNSNKEFVVNNNERIAQMIVAPVLKVDFEEVSNLPDSVRGSGGFGSTGK